MKNEDLIAELNEDNQLEAKEVSSLQIKAEELKATATTKAAEFEETAAAKASELKAAAEVKFAGTKEQLCEYQGSVEDYIRKNPLASVGIAAGVGFLLGLASRGK